MSRFPIDRTAARQGANSDDCGAYEYKSGRFQAAIRQIPDQSPDGDQDDLTEMPTEAGKPSQSRLCATWFELPDA
jgi:hypothetical protein